MGPKWKLDNYQVDQQGRPTEPKRNETTPVVMDLDGDGVFDKAGEHPDPDLRFINLNDDGQVWIRSVPVSSDWAKKDLRILISHWVRSLSGSGQLAVYDQSSGVAVSESRTFSSRITNEASGMVSGYEAQFARVDLSNLEQLKLDPKHRTAVFEIALVRTDYVWSAHQKAAFPVYLLIGYRNHPDYFDGGLDDFHELLQRVDLIPPPALPEQVAKTCSLDNRPLNASVEFISSTGELKRIRLVQGSNSTGECMAKELAKAQFPPRPSGREAMLVHASARGEAKTVIPDLSSTNSHTEDAEANGSLADADADAAISTSAEAEAQPASGDEPTSAVAAEPTGDAPSL